MDHDSIAYGLTGLLAIALGIAFVTDLRERKIYNKLIIAIAALAPAYWWASGDALWPDVPIHIATAVVTFVVFLFFFRFGLMGGGDVKLLAAMGLWFDWLSMFSVLWLTAIIGGIVTVLFWIEHRARRREGPPKIPYGVAIALAGIWVLSEDYFNQFV